MLYRRLILTLSERCVPLTIHQHRYVLVKKPATQSHTYLFLLSFCSQVSPLHQFSYRHIPITTTTITLLRLYPPKIKVYLPHIFLFLRFPSIHTPSSPIPLPLLPMPHPTLLFVLPNRLLTHFPKMISRTPTITPLFRQLLFQYQSIPSHIEFPRNPPQRLCHILVPHPYLLLPLIIPTQSVILEFTRVFQRFLPV